MWDGYTNKTTKLFQTTTNKRTTNHTKFPDFIEYFSIHKAAPNPRWKPLFIEYLFPSLAGRGKGVSLIFQSSVLCQDPRKQS